MTERVEPAEHAASSSHTNKWLLWSAAAIVLVLLALGFYGVARDDKNLATLVALGLATLALIGIVSFVFRTLQSIAEPRDEDVLADLAPTEAEARKTTALRALKDIDYEHALGNLSDADHAELTTRYRAEAKVAMRAVDDERKERRARAEALAAEELARIAAEAAEESDESASDEEHEESEREEAHADGNPFVAKTCPKCGKENDADAKFCKACGTVIEAEAS